MPVIATTSLAELKEVVISPIFERLSNEVTGINFYKVDCDKAEEICHEVGIRVMPTFILFRGGEKAGEVKGAHPSLPENLVKTPALIA